MVLVWADFLEDSATTGAFDAIAAGSLREKLSEILDDLTPREADIIRRRFGLAGTEETLEDIGRDYNVTRERSVRSKRRRSSAWAVQSTPAC